MNTEKNFSPILMQQGAAKAELLLKELANAHRLMLLCHLVTGEKTVSQLTESIGISQSSLSQHLARLRESGLVDADKRGKQVYYRISSMEAQTLLSVLYLMFCGK